MKPTVAALCAAGAGATAGAWATLVDAMAQPSSVIEGNSRIDIGSAR